MICPSGNFVESAHEIRLCVQLRRPPERRWNAGSAPLLAAVDITSLASRLLQKFGAQHQALDLVGAAFDLVGVVGEVDVLDHGAALEHGG